MLEITVISGKGGTGKTSLTGAFAHMASNHVICDLDVDAPDLHLLTDPRPVLTEQFFSGHLASIDPDLCTDCGECEKRCLFDAVIRNGHGPFIDPMGCEGCMVCRHFCPAQAVLWTERHCGTWYESETRFGPMIHAQLFPGQENSGRLVSLLRERAKKKAEEENLGLILSDGSPGVGCPVISSLTGSNLAVIVTEPTPSGLHDLERVAELCAHFRIPAAVIINKCDLNPNQAEKISEFCALKGLDIVGRAPYDPGFTEAMVQKRVITETNTSALADLVRDSWRRIMDIAAGNVRQNA